ncbi:Zn(II)2Cys6 transcription factor domain-containing protein [Aspergillus ibericus CBS 121593]|uniref:Zn(2)-C6 fungal-type domain-containing protein n=1 Tax=Aspergillus ibericus CBS 121593 TaxID=1448316 RepID=A0A395GHX2_9EURO|nr:hypothetical protein BO80DRAFT_439743 [Aspergillus ibericus CBS 121593]RAK95031.1 hypothetical protein BO80DRAFT_439743 [Aspergillus ibericus CBS 121593]
MSSLETRHLKACRPCSKAKVRCDPGPTDACHRCHRLGKECIRQAPKTHSVKKNTVSDVGRLERKLDNVTTLLAASQGYMEGLGGGHHSPLPASELTQLDPLQEESLEKILAEFNQRITLWFPFVVRSPPLRASDLRTIKPFLNLVIPAIVCEDTSAQVGQAIRARDYWMQHMIANGEHSLDLLQGFLVYLGWTQILPPPPRAAQINNYLHILEAQVINLDFYGEARSRIPGTVFSYLRVFGLQGDGRSSRTLEEMRAYLGCYYLVTLVSLCLGEKEPMQYTSYTDECCRTVQEAAQCESDQYLVQLVRIAHMAEKIYRAVQRHEVDAPTGLAPTAMGIRWLQRELQQLKDSFVCDFPRSAILLVHYHTLELLTYRVALERDFETANLSNYPLTQIDVLCSCLNSTKSLFDAMFTIPTNLYFQIPYTCWTQVGHGLAILSRLLVHHDPSGYWDREWAQQTISFENVVNTFALKTEEAISHAHAENISIPPIFTHIKKRTTLWKEAHQMRCSAMDRWRQEQAQTSSSSAGDAIPDVTMEDLLAMGPIWNLFSL